MEIVKVRDVINPENDGLEVVICKAYNAITYMQNDRKEWFYTCIRADNTLPRGSFQVSGSPLFYLDRTDYGDYLTPNPRGHIPNDARLRLLLGEIVLCDGLVLNSF